MKRILPYLISTLVGGVITVAIVCGYKAWELSGTALLGLLSDAFLVPGIILACGGLLVVVSNYGAFDMISFAVILFFNLFRRDVNNRKYRSFADYREAKAQKKRASVWFLLIVGAVFLLVAVAFLIAYYNI